MADDKTKTDGGEENPFAGFVSEGYKDGEKVEQPKADDAPADDSDDDADDAEDSDDDADDAEDSDDDADDADGEDEDDSDDGEDSDEDEEDEEDEEEPESSGDDDEEPEPKKKKKKVPARERIAELTRKRREAERRAEAAEARAAELEKGREKPAESEDEGDDDELVEPDPAKFKYGELDKDYIEALTDYRVEKKLRERQSKDADRQANEAAQQRAEELKGKWQSQVEAGEAKHDDFYEKVVEGARNKKWACSRELGVLIAESDVGADVAYYLAKRPTEAARISGLTPLQQAAHFGKLEAKFTSPPAKDGAKKKTEKKPKVSQAPKPPARRNKGKGGATRVKPDTTDFRAFEKMATAKG